MTDANHQATPKITCEKRGHLLLIGVNRPAKMNAFDVEMLEGLSAAFGELEADLLGCTEQHAPSWWGCRS